MGRVSHILQTSPKQYNIPFPAGYEDYPVQLVGADFPYTIPIPGEITFSLYTLITEDLPEEIVIDIDIEMQDPFPAAVPCLDDGAGNVFGSWWVRAAT